MLHEAGSENQAIAALRESDQKPAALLGVQQASEYGRGIESRQAAPDNLTAAVDESRILAVSDKTFGKWHSRFGVVFPRVL